LDARRKLGEDVRQRAAAQVSGDADLALRDDGVDLERAFFAGSSP